MSESRRRCGRSGWTRTTAHSHTPSSSAAAAAQRRSGAAANDHHNDERRTTNRRPTTNYCPQTTNTQRPMSATTKDNGPTTTSQSGNKTRATSYQRPSRTVHGNGGFVGMTLRSLQCGSVGSLRFGTASGVARNSLVLLYYAHAHELGSASKHRPPPP